MNKNADSRGTMFTADAERRPINSLQTGINFAGYLNGTYLQSTSFLCEVFDVEKRVKTLRHEAPRRSYPENVIRKCFPDSR